MDENSKDELNELNKQNIAHGGESLHETRAEDIQAVQDGRKTVQEVERIITQDEIVNAATENGLYQNMLPACLAANISLDQRLFEKLNEPMNPHDLTDKLKAAMQELLKEINKETNGVVFDGDGKLNEIRSIQESVRYGLEVNPMIKASMHEEEIEAISNKYYNATKTGMETLISLEPKEFNINWDTIFSNNSENIEKINNNYWLDEKDDIYDEEIDYYNKITGYGEITEEIRVEHKAEFDRLKEEADRITAEIQELLEEERRIQSLEDKDNEENVKRLAEIKNKKNEKMIQRQQIEDKMADVYIIEESNIEEVNAQFTAVEWVLLNLMGCDKEAIDIAENDMPKIVEEENLRRAFHSEDVTKKVSRKVLEGLIDRDLKKIKEDTVRFNESNMTNEEKKQFIIKNLISHITYKALESTAMGIGLYDKNKVEEIRRISGDIIKEVLPNSVDKNGNIDKKVIVEFLRNIPEFKDVTEENYEKKLLGIRAEEIKNEVTHLKELNMRKTRKRLIKTQEQVRKVRFDYNLLKRMVELSGDDAVFNDVTDVSTRRGIGYIIESAEKVYDTNIEKYDKRIDKLLQENCIEKCKSINSNDMTIKEKHEILTAMLSCYNIDEHSQKDVIQLLKNNFPNAVKKDGTLNEKMIIANYKTFVAPSENIKNMEDVFKYVRRESLKEVQKKFSKEFIDKTLPEFGFDRDKTPEEIENDRANNAFIFNDKLRLVKSTNGARLSDVKIKPISDEAYRKAIKGKEEEMNVGNPNVQASKREDKKQETISKVVQTENIDIEATKQVEDVELPTVINEKNIFAKIFDGAKDILKKIKNKVTSMFGNNNNSDSNNNNSSGGMEVAQDLPKESQVQPFVQTVSVDIKMAVESAEQSKKEKSASKEEEERTND